MASESMRGTLLVCGPPDPHPILRAYLQVAKFGVRQARRYNHRPSWKSISPDGHRQTDTHHGHATAIDTDNRPKMALFLKQTINGREEDRGIPHPDQHTEVVSAATNHDRSNELA